MYISDAFFLAEMDEVRQLGESFGLVLLIGMLGIPVCIFLFGVEDFGPRYGVVALVLTLGSFALSFFQARQRKQRLQDWGERIKAAAG